MRNVKLYLRDIHESMEAIETFVEGMEYAAFIQDLKTKSAVVRHLEVMGEAAKMIPDHTRRNNPGVDWRSMAGMRDRLIHAYFGIDYSIVWATIKRTIPMERPIIERIARELKSNDA